MSEKQKFEKYINLNFEDFKRLALDSSLSRHEKVGFPDSYREGKESAIFADIRTKILNLNKSDMVVMEIGPGCSQLPLMLAELSAEKSNKLIFIDSQEMLDHIPSHPCVIKYSGAFPEAIGQEIENLRGQVDAIVVYSVIQYVFVEGNLFHFIDSCLELLSEGGELLIGDIPNNSMRKRFFSSTSGVDTHKKFTGSDEAPEVLFNNLEPMQIDDSVVLAILARSRAQGFHAWVLPQSTDLPMANRREDIIIRKP